MVSAGRSSAAEGGTGLRGGVPVQHAALAVVDMVKGMDRSALIADLRIVAKSGGRSGEWTRREDETQ